MSQNLIDLAKIIRDRKNKDGDKSYTSSLLSGGLSKCIDKMEDSGAGELLITSMDRDGTQKGYDIKLISEIEKKINIPIIASGGAGTLEHLFEGVKYGKASAVLVASIFHYGTYSIQEAKQYLDSKGIPVRI